MAFNFIKVWWVKRKLIRDVAKALEQRCPMSLKDIRLTHVNKFIDPNADERFEQEVSNFAASFALKNVWLSWEGKENEDVTLPEDIQYYESKDKKVVFNFALVVGKSEEEAKRVINLFFHVDGWRFYQYKLCNWLPSCEYKLKGNYGK